MTKDISALTIHQSRERLRYENGILHESEAANHELYLQHGLNWSGHAQGLELAEITERVDAVMKEAGDNAYTAGKAAGEKFRKRKIEIITARDNARVTVRHDLKELTDTITKLFHPTEHRKVFPNPIPESTDGTYNAKALRKWCARTTRVAMLVAEQYVDTHIEVGGESIQHFHRVAKQTEQIHDTVNKLRKHIEKLKSKAPPPVYQYAPQPMPPPNYPYWGYAPGPMPFHHKHNHHHPQPPPPQPAAQRHGKRHPSRGS